MSDDDLLPSLDGEGIHRILRVLSPLKNSKNGQVIEGFPCYISGDLSDIAGRDGFEVHLRSLPEQRLAHIRVYDSYSKFSRVKEAYHRLIAWYCRSGGSLENTTLYGMSQDDPGVTPRRLCRLWKSTDDNRTSRGGKLTTRINV